MFPARQWDDYISLGIHQSVGAVEGNEDHTGLLCKLLLQQGASEVEIEGFDGNPINYQYFKAIFKEVVEDKTDDPRGRLQYTQGEAK